jgi:hypothetical protein
VSKFFKTYRCRYGHTTKINAALLFSRGVAPIRVNLSYSQLSRRAMSAIFPVIRENNRVYAVGDPAEIARMILNEESKLSSKAA